MLSKKTQLSLSYGTITTLRYQKQTKDRTKQEAADQKNKTKTKQLLSKSKRLDLFVFSAETFKTQNAES